ncbi:diaminopimelate epimerase [Fusobacterium sp.]|uniref:diaminopimelate epimerase n=1 Tax=Fusobacterium sp. TaxID=68766 RepID=UPI0025B83FA7|nr:diaminopimelate epimerase [Fusobacterium sp.]
MKFSKLQAAGNDFILINGMEKKGLDLEMLAKKMCDRHFGVGADGLMTCEESEIADIKMNYYNSDGSRGEMCGNGIRCFSKFIYDNKIVTKERFSVETDAGIKNIVLTFKEDELKYISVNMGRVDFRSEALPCTIKKDSILEEKIIVEGQEIRISSVLMGVPHTVIVVDDYKNYDVDRLGRAIEYSTDIFPRKTNVNFIKVIDDGTIEIKTWERGASRTLGCGTGSCASAAIAYKLGKIKSKKVKMLAEGGVIFIELDEDYNILMRGEAETICNGEFLK